MRTLLAITALCVAVCVSSAHAHPPPKAARIVFDASGQAAVLPTNRGLIFGDIPTNTWRMMCGAALGIPLTELPDLAYLADGRLIVATSIGLRVSPDRGCSWEPVPPLGARKVAALVQHPSERNTLFASAEIGGSSTIQVSQDGGARWIQRYAAPAGDVIERLAIAQSMPAHLYGTGRTGTTSHYFLSSSDSGATWEKLILPLEPNETSAALSAVSPRDPNVALVVAFHRNHGLETDPTREPGPDRLLVTRDAGQTWTALMSSVGLESAGFGTDGSTIWLAGADGLFRGAATGALTKFGEAQLVSCVGAQGGKLYACGNYAGFDPLTDGIGISTDEGVSFAKLMAFVDVVQTVSCEPASNTSKVCADLWTDWQLEELVGVKGLSVDSVFPNGIPEAPSLNDAGMMPAAGSSNVSSAGMAGIALTGNQSSNANTAGTGGPSAGANSPAAMSGSGCNAITSRSELPSPLCLVLFAWVFARRARRRDAREL